MEPKGMPPRRERLPKRIVAIALAMLLNTGLIACLVPSNVTVPDLRGKSESDATQMLTSQSLRLNESAEVATGADPGTVIDQDPKPGAALARNGVVSVTLEATRSTVPDLSGKSVGEAGDVLTAQKLIIGSTFERIAGGTPGAVFEQDPANGASVLRGTRVNVTVEASRVAVPKLVGKPEAEVSPILTGQGLKPGAQTSEASRLDPPPGSQGTVFAQDPAAGQMVDARSAVNLSVEAGVHSAGRVSLTLNAPAASLDDGHVSATDLGDFSLVWTCNYCTNNLDMSIQPQSGATLAEVGQAFVGLRQCESALATSARSKIPLTVWNSGSGQWQKPLVGMYVCARTRQGRLAELVQEESNGAFIFHYTTWNPTVRIINIGPLTRIVDR